MKKVFIPAMVMFVMASCTNEPVKTQSGEGIPSNTEKKSSETPASPDNAPVSNWMSWEGGIDVAGVTDKNLKMPNVIFHVARMVNTPVGSAPSGLVLYQPDSTKAPVVMGYVCTDTTIGKYYGPNIFAGTPFEKAPVIKASFDIKYDAKGATAKLTAGGHTFECIMSDLGKPYLVSRNAGSPMPFYQQGVEQTAGKVSLKVDGKEVNLILPPKGISGGPAAVVSPNGVYAR